MKNNKNDFRTYYGVHFFKSKNLEDLTFQVDTQLKDYAWQFKDFVVLSVNYIKDNDFHVCLVGYKNVLHREDLEQELKSLTPRLTKIIEKEQEEEK